MRKEKYQELLPLLLAILKFEQKERETKTDEDLRESGDIRDIIQRMEEKLSDGVKVEIEEKSSIKIEFENPVLAQQHKNAVKSFAKGSQRIELLYKSSLITLISSVEWFFSRILHDHYQKYPEAVIEKSTHEFTFSELKKFKSIEDARSFLLDKKIDSVIRQNFKDWIRYIKNDLKLTSDYITNNDSCLYEIFLRRNLLVHNNGIVNNIYLSSISEHPSTNLREGSMLLMK